MDRRQKLLLVIAAVALLGLGLDQFALRPWMETMSQVQKDIDTLGPKTAAATKILRDEKKIQGEWKKITEQMAKHKPEEAANVFTGFLDVMTDAIGLAKTTFKPDSTARAIAGTGLKEYAVDMTFQCKESALVRFLLEIKNADEFIKIQRMGITSQSVKDGSRESIDVTMRLSTIAGTPGAQK